MTGFELLNERLDLAMLARNKFVTEAIYGDELGFCEVYIVYGLTIWPSACEWLVKYDE